MDKPLIYLTLNEVKCKTTAIFFFFINILHIYRMHTYPTHTHTMCVHRVCSTQINECVRRLQSSSSAPSMHLIEARKRLSKIPCRICMLFGRNLVDPASTQYVRFLNAVIMSSSRSVATPKQNGDSTPYAFVTMATV